MADLTPKQIERLRAVLAYSDAQHVAPVVAAMLAEARADERKRIADEITSRYLGPDFGRLSDGRDSPDAALHDAYDEGLETAARIARGEA